MSWSNATDLSEEFLLGSIRKIKHAADIVASVGGKEFAKSSGASISPPV